MEFCQSEKVGTLLLAVLVDWAGAAPELNQECSSSKKQNKKGI